MRHDLVLHPFAARGRGGCATTELFEMPTLDRDEVIEFLRREGGLPGHSASSGKDFQRAAGLRFQRCCGSDDKGYGRSEFIARGRRGGYLYISRHRRTGVITCGRHGYHTSVPEKPVCI